MVFDCLFPGKRPLPGLVGKEEENKEHKWQARRPYSHNEGLHTGVPPVQGDAQLPSK